MRGLPATLRSRLMWTVVVALIPVLGLVGYLAVERHDRTLRSHVAEASRLLRSATLDQENVFDVVRTDLELLSHVQAVRTLDGAEATRLFLDVRKDRRFVANLSLTAADGRVVASAKIPSPGLNVGDHPLVRRVREERRFAIGRYEIGPITGRRVIACVLPVFGDDGEMIGFIAESIELEWLGRSVQRTDIPPGTVFVIADRDGRLLTRGPDAEAPDETPERAAALLAEMGAARGSGTWVGPGLDGVERTFAIGTTADYPDGPVTAVGIPVALARTAARDVLLRGLAVTAAFALLCCALAWWAAGRLILREHHAILATVRRFAAGDLGARTGLRGEGELAEIGRTFDDGAARLELATRQHEQAERALRESVERFREIVGVMDEVFWVAAADRRVEYLSPAFERIWGRPVSALLDHPERLPEWIHPDDREPTRKAFADRAEDRTREVTYRIVRPDGEVRTVHSRGTPVRDEQGNIVRIVGITQDVTELRRHESELVESGRRLAALARRLQTVREDEQARIARELHDEFGQVLTALKLGLESIRADLERRQDPLARRADHLVATVDGTFALVRRIASELRPPLLDHLGLTEAARWCVEQFSTATHVKCAFTSDVDAEDVDRDVGVAAFRVLQEALTNVARHAGASNVRIRLARDGGLLELVVEDDGRGFDPAAADHGISLGILGMRERAAALGGEVAVERNPGGGTRVRLRVPRRKDVTS